MRCVHLKPLARVPFSRVYSNGQGSIGPVVERQTATTDVATLDLPPSDLIVIGTDESVHLRFLAGAAVTAADAPSFLETGADIGAWGMPLTRELSSAIESRWAVYPADRAPTARLAERSS